MNDVQVPKDIGDEKDDGAMPLHVPGEKGLVDVAESLIDQGADVNTRGPVTAIARGRATVCRLLVEREARSRKGT